MEGEWRRGEGRGGEGEGRGGEGEGREGEGRGGRRNVGLLAGSAAKFTWLPWHPLTLQFGSSSRALLYASDARWVSFMARWSWPFLRYAFTASSKYTAKHTSHLTSPHHITPCHKTGHSLAHQRWVPASSTHCSPASHGKEAAITHTYTESPTHMPHPHAPPTCRPRLNSASLV